MSRENVLEQLKTLETELADQLALARFETLMMLVSSASNEEAITCANMRFDNIREVFNKRISLIMDEYDRDNKELENYLDRNMDVLIDPNESDEIRAISKENLDMLNIRMEMSDREREALTTFNDNVNKLIDETKEFVIDTFTK